MSRSVGLGRDLFNELRAECREARVVGPVDAEARHNQMHDPCNRAETPNDGEAVFEHQESPPRVLHVHVRVEAVGSGLYPADYCARVSVFGGRPPADTDGVGCVRIEVDRERGSRFFDSDRLQYLVLVSVGERRESAERMLIQGGRDIGRPIWAHVRLQPLNLCCMAWADPSELAPCLVGESLAFFEIAHDRELISPHSAAWGFAVEEDELPDEIVERCPQLMDDVAGYDPEPEWWRLIAQSEQVDVGFRVVLDGGRVGIVFAHPNPEFLIEGIQLVTCPHEARHTAFEVGSWRRPAHEAKS